MITIEEWYAVYCRSCGRELGQAERPSSAEALAVRHNAAEHPCALLPVVFQ